MKTVILLFDNYTALDIVGPYEVLSRLPAAEIHFAGLEKRDYQDSYGLRMSAGYAIDEVEHADILLIPGGFGIDTLLSNTRILTWIKKLDSTTRWTVSVCSGSLLLAQTGLLDNKECTTHWRRKNQLQKYNVRVRNARYVKDGKIITSAGVSAGIDMALYLVSQIAGDTAAKMIQLAIEYDPQPPFDCGSPAKIPEVVLDRLIK